MKLFLLAAQAALLNGLVGETDSLLKAMLATIDENFDSSMAGLEKTTQNVLCALGFMVIVPCNPEDQFFQIAEGIIQLIKLHDWSADEHRLFRCRIYAGIVRYLASQLQEKLPYGVPYVNSNDTIFIGDEDFKREANQLMDFCFGEILEAITQMNDVKAQHLRELHWLCMLSANVIVQNCQVAAKKINSMTNKMFKMADGYLAEYNTQLGEGRKTEHMTRNYLNQTFDSFKRKREAAVNADAMRQSTTSEQGPA